MIVDVEGLIKNKKTVEIVSAVMYILLTAVITVYFVYVATQNTLETFDYLVLITSILLALGLAFTIIKSLKFYDKFIILAKNKNYTLIGNPDIKKVLSKVTIVMLIISAVAVVALVLAIINNIGKPILEWKSIGILCIFWLNCTRCSILAFIDDKIKMNVTFNED